MLYVTAISPPQCSQHDRITSVRWLNDGDGVSNTSSVAEMVTRLDKGNEARVGGEDGPATVGVVRPTGGSPYLRTHANQSWNLTNCQSVL